MADHVQKNEHEGEADDDPDVAQLRRGARASQSLSFHPCEGVMRASLGLVEGALLWSGVKDT
jgi:hypothetical protein